MLARSRRLWNERAMRRFDLAIHGFGLIPGLLAIHLLGRSPGQTLLLLSGDQTIGGETLEPVLTSSLSEPARRLVEPFTVARWPGFFVTRDGTPHQQSGEVLLLDPVQVALELESLLSTDDMVLSGGAVGRNGQVISWTGGQAIADDFVDLASLTRREQSAEILGLEVARSLPLPVLVDFNTGNEPWDAFQHIPLGDERVYVRKRRCLGDPIADLTTGLGMILSELIAY
jgi:hypothetical protein